MSSPRSNGLDESGEHASLSSIFIPHPTVGVSALKMVGAVATLLGIICAVIGASAASLSTHEAGQHDKAVGKDVYVVHVKLADERHSESKAQRAAILAKLDVLISRGY